VYPVFISTRQTFNQRQNQNTTNPVQERRLLGNEVHVSTAIDNKEIEVFLITGDHWMLHGH